MDPGGSDERPEAAVRGGSDRRQAVRGGGARRAEDFQHGGVLQPFKQSLVHHASYVYTQTRTRWVYSFFSNYYYILYLHYCSTSTADTVCVVLSLLEAQAFVVQDSRHSSLHHKTVRQWSL